MPVTGTTLGRVRRERGAARVRVGGALLVLLAVVPGVGAWLVFGVWMPGSSTRYDAYRGAGMCGGASAGDDCLRTVTLKVDGITRSVRGGTQLTATTVSGPSSETYRTSLGDSGPVASALHKGDEITATAWRGDLMEVARGDLRQLTSDEPREEPQPQAALGTYGALLAALSLAYGALCLARPHGFRRLRRSPYPQRLFLSLGAVSAAVGVLGVWTHVPWQVVPPLTVLFSAGVAYLVVNWNTPQKRARNVGSGSVRSS